MPAGAKVGVAALALHGGLIADVSENSGSMIAVLGQGRCCLEGENGKPISETFRSGHGVSYASQHDGYAVGATPSEAIRSPGTLKLNL